MSPAARTAKYGSAADRAAVAAFLKMERAKGLPASGSFPYADWQRQLFIAGRNRLARLTAARRTFRVIHDEAQESARAIVADPWGQREADRAQAAELARDPLGGYLG